MELQVAIGSLQLKNPVLVASGTFGYGDECLQDVDVEKLGGVITKSLSRKPREGNPPPRIVETASGMLNSIGLANIGVERFIADRLPRLKHLKTAVIANVAASSIDEYCEVVSMLDREEGIAGYEINISCPNVKEGGLSFGTNQKMTAEITRRVRALTKRTLIVKLSPNVTRISEFARAAADEGADAVSLINTVVGMAVDIQKRSPKLSTVTGGLSGPAIKPIALAKVYEAAQAVAIPIIGIGGIMTAEDALEFIMVGATAVEIGTANYIDPAAGLRVVDGIREFCTRQNISRLSDLVGSLKVEKEFSVLHSWL